MTGQAAAARPPTGAHFEAPVTVAGDYVAGAKIVNNYYTSGLEAPRFDAAVRNFLAHYVGTPERPAPFGGRAADLAALDAWLAEESAPPYGLLAAPAGRGKSGLLAHWVTRLALAQAQGAPLRHIVFFPISIRFNTNTESVVFAALAARLARLYGQAQPEANQVDQYRSAFTELLYRPPDDTPLLIVLDGLDEAVGWSVSADLFPDPPRAGLRVLVAARQVAGDPTGQAWLNQLGWETPGRARRFTLDTLDAAGVADALQHMGPPLNALAAQPAVVQTLTTLTEGDSLLLRLYIEALLPQGQAAAALSPAALQGLKPGFQAYFDQWFAEQRKLWGQERPLQDKPVRALLSLCALALGPLRRDDLLALAPEAFEDSFVLEEAAGALRRFIIGDGDTAGYVFSHPRLDDYFAARLSEAERRRWGRRFLDYGAAHLQALSAGEVTPAQASGYLVQYYGLHLDPDAQHPPHPAVAALVCEPWLRAHEAAAGTPLGFLADAGRAWRRAEANGPAALGRQAAAMLCFASVAALSASVPWDLLAPCVAAGVIPLALGLALARQKTDAADCARALIELAPLLPEAERAAVLAEALAAVERLQTYAVEEVLRTLAAQLPPELVPRAAAIVAASAYVTQPAQLTAQLAARLPEAEAAPRYAAAIAGARAMPDHLRGEAWRGLLPVLPADQAALVLPEARALAEAEAEPEQRARGLAALLPYTAEAERPARLAAALAAAEQIEWDGTRTETLLALADDLPPALQDQARAGLAAEFHRAAAQPRPAIKAARRAIRPDDEQPDRDGRWVRLVEQYAPFLPEAEVRAALADAETIDIVSLRTQALAALAPRLPPAEQHTLFEQILHLVRQEADDNQRAWALSYIGDHLPEDLLPEAIAAARAAPDVPPQVRVPLLRQLALRLPPNQRAPALAEALAAARALRDEPFRARALAALAEVGPPAERAAGLTAAWRVVQSIPFINLRIAEAGDLAAHPLPEAVLDEMLTALEAAQPRLSGAVTAPTLAALAPQLSGPRLARALALTRAMDHAPTQIGPWLALAARLPEAEATALSAEAAAAVRALTHVNLRAEAWVTLLTGLPSAQRAPYLPEAAEAVRAQRHANLRAANNTGLAAVAEDPDLALRLTAAAFTAMTEITDGSLRADSFAQLMPRIPDSFRHAALQVASEAADDWARGQCLAALAPRLAGDPALLAVAVGQALRMQLPAAQARALAALSAAHPLAERAAVLADAWAALEALDPDSVPSTLIEMAVVTDAPERLYLLRQAAARADALAAEKAATDPLGGPHAALLRALPEAEQVSYGRELLARIRELPADRRAQALTTVFQPGPWPETLLAETLDLAVANGAPELARQAAGRWPAVCAAGKLDPLALLARTLHAVERSRRADALTLLASLAPALAAVGGPAALTDTAQAILATGQWWP
ncbi:MAG: hypothetical protein IT317_20590 [Anaerolineales bacterium]|nr:hypothetical protein [Anaerolineales bacterium]